MDKVNDLDAHASPPEALRTLFKGLQKSSAIDVAENDSILDFERPASIDAHAHKLQSSLDVSEISGAVASFLGYKASNECHLEVYEVTASPGAVNPSVSTLQTSDGCRSFHLPQATVT